MTPSIDTNKKFIFSSRKTSVPKLRLKNIYNYDLLKETDNLDIKTIKIML